MTAAHRLKGIGRFGSCVAIVLGCYLVSLQVAAERKKLDEVNGRIRAAERDIRALETEFDTRANLAQLERWNGDTLALSAPVAGQFVTSEAALAALDVRALPGDGVRTAGLVVPSLAGVIPVGAPGQTPAPVTAPVTAPAPVRQAVVRMAAVMAPQPQVVRASVVRAVAPTPRQEAAIVRTAAMAKVRPQAVAMLDRKLLSDTTLGDILSGARVEAGKRR